MTQPLIVNVTSVNFDAEVAKADKLVLIQFTADWCIPCQRLLPKLAEIAVEQAKNLKIVQIDVASSPELAKMFNIRLLPAIFVMNHGEKYAEAVGDLSKNALEKLLTQALQKVTTTNIDTKNRDAKTLHSMTRGKRPRR